MTDDVIRALIVDADPKDDGSAAMLLADVLGIDPVRVPSAAAASIQLRQRPIDLVLVELRDDDVEPVRWLSDRVPSLPIIVLDGTGDPDIGHQAIRHGAQDVIPRSAATVPGLRRAIVAAIERKRLEQHKIRYARLDELTGVGNPLLLEERFERALARADRQATLIALVAIDLDHVEEVVARHGRDAANRLLLLAGRRLAGEIRETDTLARTRDFGFTWLVEGLAAISDINSLLDRLPRLLAAPFSVDDLDIQVTGSAGVAVCPFHGRRFHALHAMAEAAMTDVARLSGDGLLMLPLPALADHTRSQALS